MIINDKHDDKCKTDERNPIKDPKTAILTKAAWSYGQHSSGTISVTPGFERAKPVQIYMCARIKFHTYNDVIGPQTVLHNER